jgi:hypothetical protein
LAGFEASAYGRFSDVHRGSRKALDEAGAKRPSDFDALLLPGGVMLWRLRELTHSAFQNGPGLVL